MEKPICPIEAARPDPSFRLIETFGYVPGQGISRAELHVARVVASAAELGFRCNKPAIEATMIEVAGNEPLRCRLTLGIDGDLEVTTAPMPKRWHMPNFVISDVRLNSDDQMLRHKTTRRALYDKARAALPVGTHEAVLLNERGELCEGTITNIMLTTPDGEQLTPALSSGCLPGVYRQSMLDHGRLREAVLTLTDLSDARHIYLINSLRGATQALWAPECAQFARFA
ncbi:4-amino-4-deoxychorismate lyase [Sedimentitalea sp. CY04]|uniref:Probable branched-chain-amino-acid aminotransferase n=1 Tax=Parasedimentitalea denitrificans TaxID=2211118 RepID=A0ABX0WAJ9_9RHOB|nr:aminotransferase class IV family protein [Sedimentitalea sp. CY04]NIZ61819.1 4-amino-4-deoxychorismate lyase [Sedimentitalea sp. CY04]